MKVSRKGTYVRLVEIGWRAEAQQTANVRIK